MNKLFPLDKKKKKKGLCERIRLHQMTNDQQACLSLQYEERTDEHAEHKLFTQINAVHQHSVLKGQRSLMVIICGDRPSLIDVIAPCWCTGEGDSAFPPYRLQLW